MSDMNPNEVIAGPVRLGYMNVFKPKLNLNNETVYSAVLLIPKQPNDFCTDPVAVGKKLTGAIKAALHSKFGKEPPKWTNPLRDGDTELDNEGGAKYEGYWFCNVKAREEYQPLLIDGQKQPARPNDWKSGDWGVVKVSCYGYDKSGNQGVGVGLRAVQFLYQDEGFGGSQTSADEFETVENAVIPATPSEDAYDPFADE